MFKIKKALNIAKRADASMSKFSKKLDNEDKVTKGFGKKRKFESNFSDLKNENAKHLKVFEKLTSNKDKSSKQKLNIDKASNKLIAAEGNGSDSSSNKKKGKGGAGGGKGQKKGGKRSAQGGKRPAQGAKRSAQGRHKKSFKK